MYNLFFKILILIIILSTFAVLGIKPKMHNKVFIYNSEYSLVEEIPDETAEVAIPQKEQVQKVMTSAVMQEKKQIQKNNESPKKVTVDKIKSTEPKKQATKTQNVVHQVIPKQTQTLTKKEPEKTVVQNKIEPKKEEIIAKTEQKPEIKVLTQSEEEIAWNIWRSNLQNQIMKDVRLPYVPKGTVFKFTFDVDKYGRITNIKTWSLTSNYTPYAIQYIAPVIRSYQGKDILDFPNGTQRFNTNFTGGWKISDNAKYSTPNDYNDIEKVKK